MPRGTAATGGLGQVGRCGRRHGGLPIGAFGGGGLIGMGMGMQKFNYLVRSVTNFTDASRWCCPNCGGVTGEELDRKFLVTRLIRCGDCQLQYRAPTDSEQFNSAFYNYFYKQGTTTQMPGSTELEQLCASQFEGTEQAYSRFIGMLKREGVVPGMRVFDFGCSWGYGSYQFRHAGYEVDSYEIAVDRRNFGIEKLGVRHIDEPFAIADGHPLYQSYDCFFSAHVLEHVPAPSRIFNLAWKCLKPGGLFVAVAPNGSAAYRRHNPGGWRRLWGGVHPNFLDDDFYNIHFSRSKRHFVSPSGGDPFSNSELGFVAKKDSDQGGF